MVKLVDSAATDEIKLADGTLIVVRQQLTAAEETALSRMLTKLQIEAGSRKITSIDYDGAGVPIAVCKAYIVSWDGVADTEGKPIAYTPGLVDRLPAETVREIAESIDALQTERRERQAGKGLKP